MKINMNTDKTLNSWFRCCKKKLLRHKNNYGYKVVVNINITGTPDEQLWKCVFDGYNKSVEHWITLDKSCLDDDTGSNSALDKLSNAVLNKRIITTQWLEHDIDRNGASGIIGSCVEKYSSVFDFICEYNNMRETIDSKSQLASKIIYRTAGVYGDAVIIGFSENNITEKLELETIKLFS